MATTDKTAPALPAVATLSFEAALAELEALVRQVEQGSLPLAAAVAAYARGQQLGQHCLAQLQQAQLQITQIQQQADGSLSTQPFNPNTP